MRGLRNYEVGSPRLPGLVIIEESHMVPIVKDTIRAGRKVVISKAGHAGELTVWQEMDGMVSVYQCDGKERRLVRWPMWAHWVRKLLTETSEKKEGA